MSDNKFTQFNKGARLVPTDSGPDPQGADPTDNIEGSLWVRQDVIKSYIEAAIRTVVTDTQTQTLTNKTLTAPVITGLDIDDDEFTISDAVDGTIEIEFDAAGTTGTKTTITSSQTTDKVVTLPDATDTLVGKATTDTLTNKTFDADGTGNSLTNVEDANIKAGAAIDAAKIHDASVSNTEFGYLDGVTSAIQTQLGSKEDTANKSAANGYASLDSGSKVPIGELPDAVLGGPKFAGTWNANTNTPDVGATSPSQGDYYRVSVAGTTNLDGITDWGVGDWAIYNGTAWDKIDNSESVTSVNGQTGAVTVADTDLGNLTSPTAINQDLLSDTHITRDLGAQANRWAEVWTDDTNARQHQIIDSSGDVIGQIEEGGTSPSGKSEGSSFSTTGATPDLGVFTENEATADANPTGDVNIETGNKGAGTGDSGDITVQTGTSSGGTRGNIELGANTIKILPATAPTVGQMWSATNTDGSGEWIDQPLDGASWLPVSKNAAYTAVANDFIIADAATIGAFTITLPAAASNSGARIAIKKSDSGTNAVTIDGNLLETIDNDVSTTINTRYETLYLVSNGINWSITSRYIDQGRSDVTLTGAWTTNTTYHGKLQRDGEDALITARLEFVGQPNAVDFTLVFPTGIVIDTSKFPNNAATRIPDSRAMAFNSGVEAYDLTVAYNNTTSVKIRLQEKDAGSNIIEEGAFINRTVPFSFNTNDRVEVYIRIPVVGWKG